MLYCSSLIIIFFRLCTKLDWISIALCTDNIANSAKNSLEGKMEVVSRYFGSFKAFGGTVSHYFDSDQKCVGVSEC